MDFKIEERQNHNKIKYKDSDLHHARQFAIRIKEEAGEMIKAVVIFGSTARKKANSHDVDMLVLIDDLTYQLTKELVETYRIIVTKIVQDVSTKLHITSLKYSSFWEYVRAGDPVAVNILRDGVPMIDTGVFRPLQVLLEKGRIRPTEESMWNYFSRSPITLRNAKWHLLQAALDLYWAVIDAAHSALMKIHEIPPSPEHVADLIEKKLVTRGKLTKKHVKIVRKFYVLSKMITHREIKGISGQEFDLYYEEANEFINAVKEYLESH
jgi:predicted nucleotidyltransferase